MRVTHIKTSTGLPSKLILTIATKRERMFLLSLFNNTEEAHKMANNPATTHVLIGEEDPFTIEEVKEIIDSVFVKL